MDGQHLAPCDWMILATIWVHKSVESQYDAEGFFVAVHVHCSSP